MLYAEDAGGLVCAVVGKRKRSSDSRGSDGDVV
jgi:hypothetical protein